MGDHVARVAWDVPRPHAALTDWLDDVERGRMASLVQPVDRDRFATSRVLLKTAVAGAAGLERATDVRLGYACDSCDRPHGRPRVLGPAAAAGLHVSLAHAGERVLVAVTAAGPVGVDVEPERAAAFDGFTDLALTAAEADRIAGLPVADRLAAATCAWVRKEAVLKATGDGLRVAPNLLEVSDLGRPPALLAWTSDRAAPVAMTMADLDVGPGYLACLAVATADALVVRVTP